MSSGPDNFIAPYWTYRLNKYRKSKKANTPSGRPGHPSNGCKNLVTWERWERADAKSKVSKQQRSKSCEELGVLTQSTLTLPSHTLKLTSSIQMPHYISTHQLLNCCFPFSQPPKSCYFQRSRPPAREKDASACASVILPIVRLYQFFHQSHEGDSDSGTEYKYMPIPSTLALPSIFHSVCVQNFTLVTMRLPQLPWLLEFRK